MTAGRRGLALLVLGCLGSAAPATAQAPGAGLDARRIDAVFAGYTGHDSPGCAVGVYRRGEIAFARGYGMADLERGVPITPATLFDLGSTSKQFTAAAVALLVADGRVALEDDVRKYVPEVPDYGTPITLDHLVRHTSGLRDYIGLLNLGGRRIDDASDDQDALDAIGRQRALNFAPGSEWDYSNSGFFLLSVVVKRVTGRTLAEFARERIFGPLGMARTHFRDRHLAVLRGRALAYSPGESGALELDVPHWDQLGDGAVWSSIEELVRWDRNFEEPTVGGAALRRRLEAPGRLTTGAAHEYGRGLFLDRYRGLERVHHGGAWGGFRAMYMRFPAERTSIALTCNVATANTQALAEQVADVVLEGRFPEQAPAAAAAAAPEAARPVDPARYLGLYYSASEQGVVRVAAREGRLVARVPGGALPLVPGPGERFEASGVPAAVEFAGPAARPADTLRLFIRGAARGVYVRVAPAAPSGAELAAYAGDYYSPELDATWRVLVEGDSLRVRSRTVDRRLEPAMADAFTGQGLLRFLRDGRRRVTGFDLSVSRVRGIRFEKRR